MIDEPVLRLTSVDLDATADVTTFAEVFDFARDYLGLLKAAAIASGLVPPGWKARTQPLADLLARLTGRPGYGIEIVSHVNDIPKGSRLAVSTSLLACLIAASMRATGQIHSSPARSTENDRRLVAARAILGEWLAGSGGGWQDSGGVWPGMKLIQGVQAAEGDPEFGISRGCLLPRHHVLTRDEVSARDAARRWKTAWCWCTAAWRRTSARSSRWSRRSTCCARRRSGTARLAGDGDLRRDRRPASKRATSGASAAPPNATSSDPSRPSSRGPPISTPKR